MFIQAGRQAAVCLLKYTHKLNVTRKNVVVSVNLHIRMHDQYPLTK